MHGFSDLEGFYVAIWRLGRLGKLRRDGRLRRVVGCRDGTPDLSRSTLEEVGGFFIV